MSWRDLLQAENETIILPWIGGRELRSLSRTWTIAGDLPREHGWYRFKILKGRTATVQVGIGPDGLTHATCAHFSNGYLIGDRFAADDFSPRFGPDGLPIFSWLPRVHLIDNGIDRFARISVGMIYPGGPMIFGVQQMPLGPEDAVLRAYEDRKTTVDDIKGVTPALNTAFYMETRQRAEAERRRAELEKRRAEEEAKRAAEERRRQLVEKLGDGASRRQLAKVDFGEAARAALAVGGAELLDWKVSRQAREFTVRFRFDGQRFECVCDENLHVLDAGICLIDHRTGIKGDTWFTLESLPAVVREAIDTGKLVRFRHV
jgi:hypothetical protein